MVEAEVTKITITIRHFSDIDSIKLLCDTEEYIKSKSKTLAILEKDINNVSKKYRTKMTTELCPYCEKEVEIQINKKSSCPKCGADILPCSMCSNCIVPCPLEPQNTTLEFGEELRQIIKVYKDGSTDTLDGSEINILTEHLKNQMNLHEGNITYKKYLELKGCK